MGSNPSTAQAEQRFIDAVKEIKDGKEESIDNIISKAYNVPDFYSCFSFFDVQSLYTKYPKQVKALTLKLIEYLVSQKDPQMIQTCISLLSRIIPSLALSMNKTKEFDWLFEGENSAIVNMFTELKSILFAPFILNQEEADNQLVWFWGTQLHHKVETARTDSLSLLFLGHNGQFFFPNDKEIQEQNKKLACVDSNIAKYLLDSIAEAIWWHNIHFLTVALPYLSVALIDDESIRNLLKTTNLTERLVDLMYVPVDDLNVYVHYTYSLANIEIDLFVLCFICLIIDQKSNYNVQKLAISTLRFLQLANESDPNIVGINHRLSLSILTIIFSSKINSNKLKEKLNLEELGTNHKFSPGASISLSIFEAVTETVSLIKSDSSSILSLVISVIHNISPFIEDFETAPSLFQKLIEIALNKFKEKKIFFDALCTSIERYVNGSNIENDKNGQNKRKELNKMVENLPSFSNGQNDDLKQKLIKTIQNESIQKDYPLVIDQIDTHLEWSKQIVFELFKKRNQISLDRIRKNKQNLKKS